MAQGLDLLAGKAGEVLSSAYKERMNLGYQKLAMAEQQRQERFKSMLQQRKFVFDAQQDAKDMQARKEAAAQKAEDTMNLERYKQGQLNYRDSTPSVVKHEGGESNASNISVLRDDLKKTREDINFYTDSGDSRKKKNAIKRYNDIISTLKLQGIPGVEWEEPKPMSLTERQGSAENFFVDLQNSGIPPDVARKMVRKKFGI